jgi:hypothetical protein
MEGDAVGVGIRVLFHHQWGGVVVAPVTEILLPLLGQPPYSPHNMVMLEEAVFHPELIQGVVGVAPGLLVWLPPDLLLVQVDLDGSATSQGFL